MAEGKEKISGREKLTSAFKDLKEAQPEPGAGFKAPCRFINSKTHLLVAPFVKTKNMKDKFTVMTFKYDPLQKIDNANNIKIGKTSFKCYRSNQF